MKFRVRPIREDASLATGYYVLLGANMIMAMPANATDAPTRSQALGLTPSTDHSHKRATNIKTPQ